MDAGYFWFLAYLAFRSCNFTVRYRLNNLVSSKGLEVILLWQVYWVVLGAGKIGCKFNWSVSNGGWSF
jgi:hypothetical protein